MIPGAAAGVDPGREAMVRVPGSTSNLGGGFDCVGMAVDRWLTVHARLSPAGAEPALERFGTLAELNAGLDEDLVHVGFAAACRLCGRETPGGLSLRAHSEIPVGRGLGSSAAALVAGAALAAHLLELGVDEVWIADLCSKLEGHPDNVAPIVFGGAMLALAAPFGRLAYSRLEVHPALAFSFAIPEFTVETKRGRGVLPPQVAHALAVAAAARGAALVQGLARADEAMLASAMDDVLHVPFRRHLVPGFDTVCAAAVGAGAFGATLSGSGSSIVAIGPRERAEVVGGAMVSAWRALGTPADAFASSGHVEGFALSRPPLAEPIQPPRSPGTPGGRTVLP